jgi:hypothetical protein
LIKSTMWRFAQPLPRLDQALFRAGPQMHAFALLAEDGEEFEWASSVVGDGVRNAGVEFGRLPTLEDEGLGGEREPQRAGKDVKPFVAFVDLLVECCGLPSGTGRICLKALSPPGLRVRGIQMIPARLTGRG